MSILDPKFARSPVDRWDPFGAAQGAQLYEERRIKQAKERERARRAEQKRKKKKKDKERKAEILKNELPDIYVDPRKAYEDKPEEKALETFQYAGAGVSPGSADRGSQTSSALFRGSQSRPHLGGFGGNSSAGAAGGGTPRLKRY